MTQRIDAIYENGMLRPLEPLDLADQERVSITVQPCDNGAWLDQDALRQAELEGDSTVSVEEVRRRLASIPGSLAETVIDERGAY